MTNGDNKALNKYYAKKVRNRKIKYVLQFFTFV